MVNTGEDAPPCARRATMRLARRPVPAVYLTHCFEYNLKVIVHEETGETFEEEDEVE